MHPYYTIYMKPHVTNYTEGTSQIKCYLCPVHIWLAIGLRSLYPAHIPFSVRPPRGLHAEAGGGCEIFVRINGLRGLYDLV